jgi:hypothetical protein
MQRRSQQPRMTHPYVCHLPVLRYEYISRRSAVSCSCLRAACRWVVTLDRRRVSRSRSHGRCPASQRICACNAGREDQEALSLRALPACLPVAKLPRIMYGHGNGRPAGRQLFSAGTVVAATLLAGAREPRGEPVCQRAPWCVWCPPAVSIHLYCTRPAASSRDPSTEHFFFSLERA